MSSYTNVSASKPPSGKFDENETAFKRHIKALRLRKKIPMGEAAALMGVTRKKLEDIEALRDYGCYIDLKTIYLLAGMLEMEPWELFHGLE